MKLRLGFSYTYAVGMKTILNQSLLARENGFYLSISINDSNSENYKASHHVRNYQ